MRSLPKFLLIFCCAICCIGRANAQLYATRLDLGGFYFTDSPHWAGVAVAYVPLTQNNNHLLYLDGRAIQKSNGKARELNLALGYRQLSLARDVMLGGYLFYDNKRTSNRNTFQQATLGVESWMNSTFFGGNFYFPFGKRVKLVSASTVSSGALTSAGSTGMYNILVTQNTTNQQEVAQVGGDASLGYQFNRPLSLYAGLYYYHSSTSHVKLPTILGPMLRARYIADKSQAVNHKFFKYFDRTTIESQVQYDSQRKWRWYIGIEFSLSQGTRSYKLTQMERHMTEQPLRDIDLVSAPDKAATTQQFIAKDSNGKVIQVFVPTAGQNVTDQIGNPNVQVIGVNGVISDFENTTALADGQTITGGSYTINVNGVSVPVNVAANGELRSKSGTNLLKIGKNNSVTNLTLTMVDPGTAVTGNRAIFADSTVNDLGTANISNVTSNGVIFISRSGAAQQATVVVNNCQFVTPSTWTPASTPAVGDFEALSSSKLTVTITNSTFKTLHTGSTQIVGLELRSNNSTLTITEISNNTIVGSDAGMVIAMAENAGKITITGDIAGNTISGGTGSLPNEAGLLIFSFPGSPTLQMNGAIKNNTITATDEAFINVNFAGGGGTNPIFNFDGGILNNKFTSTTTNAVALSRGASPTTTRVSGFNGNQVLGSVGTNIIVNGANTTVNVGSGSQGLSAANNGASVSVTNSATVNPGP